MWGLPILESLTTQISKVMHRLKEFIVSRMSEASLEKEANNLIYSVKACKSDRDGALVAAEALKQEVIKLHEKETEKSKQLGA